MNTTKSGDEKYVKANYEPPQENPQRPHPNAQGRSIRSRTEDIRTPMWLYPWECYSSQHFDCTCHYAKPTSLRVGCVSIQVRCRSFSFDQATFPWMHEAFWHQASRTTCSNSSCGSMNKTTQNKPNKHTNRWTKQNLEMKKMTCNATNYICKCTQSFPDYDRLEDHIVSHANMGHSGHYYRGRCCDCGCTSINEWNLWRWEVWVKIENQARSVVMESLVGILVFPP